MSKKKITQRRTNVESRFVTGVSSLKKCCRRANTKWSMVGIQGCYRFHGSSSMDPSCSTMVFLGGEFCHVFFANCLSLLLIFSVNDSKKIKQMPTGPSKKIRICCFFPINLHTPNFLTSFSRKTPRICCHLLTRGGLFGDQVATVCLRYPI